MKKGGMRMRIKNIVLTLKMPKKFDFLMQFAVLILILFGTLMIVSTKCWKYDQGSLYHTQGSGKAAVFYHRILCADDLFCE